jgi:hypothetical protein
MPRRRLESFEQFEGWKIAPFTHAYYASVDCKMVVCPKRPASPYWQARETDLGPRIWMQEVH